MLKLLHLVHCFFPDFEKSPNLIHFLPTFSNLCQKNICLHFLKLLISQKVLPLEKDDKIQASRIELIEFYQFIWENFIKYLLRYWFSKRNATFFLVGGSIFSRQNFFYRIGVWPHQIEPNNMNTKQNCCLKFFAI